MTKTNIDTDLLDFLDDYSSPIIKREISADNKSSRSSVVMLCSGKIGENELLASSTLPIRIGMTVEGPGLNNGDVVKIVSITKNTALTGKDIIEISHNLHTSVESYFTFWGSKQVKISFSELVHKKSVLFTGKFDYGTRKDCEILLSSNNGLVASNISKAAIVFLGKNAGPDKLEYLYNEIIANKNFNNIQVFNEKQFKDIISNGYYKEEDFSWKDYGI